MTFGIIFQNVCHCLEGGGGWMVGWVVGGVGTPTNGEMRGGEEWVVNPRSEGWQDGGAR